MLVQIPPFRDFNNYYEQVGRGEHIGFILLVELKVKKQIHLPKHSAISRLMFHSVLFCFGFKSSLLFSVAEASQGRNRISIQSSSKAVQYMQQELLPPS